MPNRYDAIVIGTGQSGPALAHRLANAGMTVAIAERHLFGGTCVNTGCIPTKTMVASAYAAHLARRAAEYGVNIGGSITVDLKKVQARKDQVSGAVVEERRGRPQQPEGRPRLSWTRAVQRADKR